MTPGPLEIGIVLLIVLVIFGPKRLPDLGKSLGSGLKSFKDSVSGDDDEDKQITKSEAKTEPARDKAESTPAGGQGS